MTRDMNSPISETWSQVSQKDRIPFETYEQGGKEIYKKDTRTLVKMNK